MRVDRLLALAMILIVAALLPAGLAARQAEPSPAGAAAATPATPVGTPVGTPGALGAEQCQVDPVDPVSYGAAVRAATSVTDPPPMDSGTPADAETTAAVRLTIETSIACSNAGDMARLLATTDPAFAPAMLGVDRADVQPAIDAAVAIAPPRGQALPPLVESYGGEVSADLLEFGAVVTFPDGTAGVTIRLDSPQTDGVATALVYLRPTDAGYLVTTWSVVR